MFKTFAIFGGHPVDNLLSHESITEISAPNPVNYHMWTRIVKYSGHER